MPPTRRLTPGPGVAAAIAVAVAAAWLASGQTAALRVPGTESAVLVPGTGSAQLVPGTVRSLGPGKILVASRGLGDPNFSETVVLLADHSEKGAMGLVLNRPTEATVSHAFPHLDRAPGRTAPLFIGGPVERGGVLALVRSAAPRPDDQRVIDGVYMVGAREPLEALIAAGEQTSRFRVYAGYSGWGPGQLDRETLHGSWHVFTAEADVIFDPTPETVWERQIRRTEARQAD